MRTSRRSPQVRYATHGWSVEGGRRGGKAAASQDSLFILAAPSPSVARAGFAHSRLQCMHGAYPPTGVKAYATHSDSRPGVAVSGPGAAVGGLETSEAARCEPPHVPHTHPAAAVCMHGRGRRQGHGRGQGRRQVPPGRQAVRRAGWRHHPLPGGAMHTAQAQCSLHSCLWRMFAQEPSRTNCGHQTACSRICACMHPKVLPQQPQHPHASVCILTVLHPPPNPACLQFNVTAPAKK